MKQGPSNYSPYNSFPHSQLRPEQDDDKSTLISRNITVLGRRTSVRLEPEMWNALREIAKREKCRIYDICSLIHLRKNPQTSLTAAIRVFLMLYYRAAATDDGHRKAGHDDFNNMMQRARMTWDMISPGDARPLDSRDRIMDRLMSQAEQEEEKGLSSAVMDSEIGTDPSHRF